MTGRALRGAIAAVIVALTVSGCGVTGPDPAACKAAMQAQFVKEGHVAPAPAACKGLPEDEVRRFAQQILQAG